MILSLLLMMMVTVIVVVMMMGMIDIVDMMDKMYMIMDLSTSTLPLNFRTNPFRSCKLVNPMGLSL